MWRVKAASSSVLVVGEGREVSRSRLWLSLFTTAFLDASVSDGIIGSEKHQADGMHDHSNCNLKVVTALESTLAVEQC